jgi:hypothetical protein
MKRGTFKKLTHQEKLAKLASKPRVTGLKRSKVAKRAKLPPIKTMRNKCDALLTPIIKKLYPYCLLTGAPTEVAHHHVKKSESSALRYYLPNLIPLTHKAHQALHSHETLYSSKIVAIKGLEWWADIEREKRKEVKVDVHWYIENYKRLNDILNA